VRNLPGVSTVITGADLPDIPTGLGEGVVKVQRALRFAECTRARDQSLAFNGHIADAALKLWIRLDVEPLRLGKLWIFLYTPFCLTDVGESVCSLRPPD
jgi:hypothetical protein